jgi:hypothetical protein
MMERLARDKRSSLFFPALSDGGKGFYNIASSHGAMLLNIFGCNLEIFLIS